MALAFLRDPFLCVPIFVLLFAILSQTVSQFSGTALFEGKGFHAVILTTVSGLSTAIGGLLVVSIKGIDRKYVAVSLAFAGGVMLYLSFSEMLPEAVEDVGLLPANLALFAGMTAFACLIHVMPDPDVPLDAQGDEVKQHLLKIGYHTAVGIALHNMPEGVAVFMGCLKGQKSGLALCLAMALHNIPEGIAVSMPIYGATNSKWQAVRFSLISGLVEPMCAIIIGFGFSKWLSTEILSIMLAAVAGMMGFLAIHDLLPTSLKYVSPMTASSSAVLGMFVIFLSIYFIRVAV
eukprot:CAMPEP_0184644552 /NCGR_PEP_ID=MMETSP0308-20130426/1259_1 /TAXON_ID=38269 /ORGANISM="Gloeochaete witrockiana, Strain SAG 46.84" /LENGTH=290 /DNA_ID=CAMNT_0027073151 /DNA_START=84 /DNA_END=956 /DNA_ORIENTATION=+